MNLDAEQTVDYILNRVAVRIYRDGMDEHEAVLDTLAGLDEELYVKVLKDGGWGRYLKEYLLKHYSRA